MLTKPSEPAKSISLLMCPVFFSRSACCWAKTVQRTECRKVQCRYFFVELSRQDAHSPAIELPCHVPHSRRENEV